MYGGNKLPKADKFLKKRKRLKLWHRLLLLAGSIVVFITTYMLILPAITAEIGTLDAYYNEDLLSSGSAVVEEIADSRTDEEEISSAESTSETTTEENSSASGSGSGGILADGTELAITLEKIEGEAEDVGVFKNIVVAAAQADGVTIVTSGTGEEGTYVCTYDPDTGEFILGLNINFTIPQTALESYSGEVLSTSNGNKSYTIPLPKDIIIPEDNLGKQYIGYESNTTSQAFYYCFEPIYDDEGNVTQYQLVMVFWDSYLDTLNTGATVGAVDGVVSIDAHVSVDSYNEDGSITIKDENLGIDITVNAGDIKYDENETVDRDVTVSKKGIYSAADGTVTYEVMVLSRKGTGDDPLKIKDSFSNVGVLENLNAELVSITYNTVTVGMHINDWTGKPEISTSNSNYPYSPTEDIINVDINDITEGSTGYYYYNSDGDEELLDDDLIIVLPALPAIDGSEYYYDDSDYYKKYNAYYIKYTYSVEPSGNIDYSFTNTASAKVTDEIAQTTIEDTSSATVKISAKTMITKSGSFDNETRSIKWTITVGDGEDSLAGFRIYDEMYSALKENMIKPLTEAELRAAIKHEDGTIASEDEYTIITDETDESIIKGIQFTENAELKYVIEYTTEVEESWESKNITNQVEMLPEEGSESSVGAEATVNVPGGVDCFTKSLDSATINDDETIYTLSWNTTFKVPSDSGIPANTTFTDSVTGTGHYITGTQAQDIVTALNNGWGSENIKDIQFYDNVSWVDAADVKSDTKYYQFRFTTVKRIVQTNEDVTDDTDTDVVNKDEISYSYSTTADISAVTDTNTYTNSLSTTGKTKSDSWTYSKNVVKYGCDSKGNMTSTGTSSATTTDGTVTWIVKFNLDYDLNSYKIIDTLPEGVTLKELYLSNQGPYNYQQITTNNDTLTKLFDESLFATYNSETVNNQQVVTIDLSEERKSEWVSALYIKYVCQINEDASGETVGDSDDETDKIYTLANHVEVTVEGEEEYGSDDQTTTVTWTEESNNDDALTKDALFDENNNIISYSLNINPEGVMYTVDGEEYSDIQLKDILSYSSYPSHGVLRNADLILNSVKLYYAETNPDGSGKLDADGNLIKGEELASSDFVWSYNDEIVPSTDYANITNYNITKYINLTIPNGVPIVFEYQYVVTLIVDESGDWANYKAEVTNGAQLSINGQQIKEVPGKEINNEVKESGTSGSVNSGSGYTIYKVDKDNFALTLPGAKFGLYVYDSTTSEFKFVDTYTTASNGSAAIKGVPVSASETDKTVIAYEITLSNGETYQIPVDTICYFVESAAPDGYKLDTTKYYFYFGSSLATSASNCGGFELVENPQDGLAKITNVIISHTEYVTNEHSTDYYAEKTNITVFKHWADSEGIDITAAKHDGSIKFNLYKVFTAVDGSQEGPPDDSGGDDTPSDDKKTLEVGIKSYSYYSYADFVSNDPESTVYDARIPQKCDPGTEITMILKNQYGGSNLDSTPSIKVNDETLEYVRTVDEKDTNVVYYSYTFTVNDDTEVSGELNWGTSDFSLDKVLINGVEVGSEETTVEGPTETTTADSSEETTAEESDFVSHIHNFSATENIESLPEGVIVDTDKGTDEGYVFDDGFFYFTGNLSTAHGTATYSGVDVMNTCLKMQNFTEIKFTAPSDGLLRLVFNSNGNGTESIINSCYIDGIAYTATDNLIVKELTAGEHTISKQNTCYLFYISFTEGESVDDSEMYAHSFNDGYDSMFYQISTAGSTATDKGIVSFYDTVISTCYKMNSKAEITFNAPSDGVINMVLTNPNNASVVGVKLDGTDHYAAVTQEVDSKGHEIYLLSVQVSAGEHTITRINSTEVMLYYIGYIPDDLGDGDISYEAPSNPNAQLVGEYEIDADMNWTRSFLNLPWQVLDDEGNTLGYWSYYIEEIDENNRYTTWYVNNVPEGISSGTMAIYNREEDNSTELTVIKKWLNSDGVELSADEAAKKESIAFDLFARVNIYDEYRDLYTGGTDHSWYYDSSGASAGDTDGFFTVSSAVQSSSSVGEVTFTPEIGDKAITTRYYLKFDNATNVLFTPPTPSGILTLTTYNWSSSSLASGIGYILTSPSGKQYKFMYSSDADNGLSGTYPGELSNAVETLAGDDTGVTIGATSSSTDPQGTGLITFTIFTDEAGEWQIARNGAQEYLLYMDFAYQYQDLIEGEGIYINNYTVTADDNWTKTISGLPYIIYDDDGVTEIGYYSYYIAETSPSDGYITTIDYTQDTEETRHAEDDGTITKGTAVITNQEKVVDVILPETGGVGTKVYTIGGALLLCCAAYLLYIRKINRGEINFK